MTGWNEHGHAVKTGLPVDRYLGQGDLQDAENCGYAPVSVLAELGVDLVFGDPQVQYRDGRIELLDGTVLERGGTLNCVWAVTKLPDEPVQYADETERMQCEADELAAAAYERGLAEGRAERANVINAMTRSAYEDGVGDGRVEGRRQATEGWQRELAVRYPDGYVYADVTAEAARAIASRSAHHTVVSRLVGPWEPDEQPEAVVPEGQALGVTHEQRSDLVKTMGDVHDYVERTVAAIVEAQQPEPATLNPELIVPAAARRRHDPGALIEEPDLYEQGEDRG